MRTKVQDDRLMELAAFLRTIPEERFNMSRFRSDGSLPKDPMNCGTTACAAGWGATLHAHELFAEPEKDDLFVWWSNMLGWVVFPSVNPTPIPT